jgi:hypothetical protein
MTPGASDRDRPAARVRVHRHRGAMALSLAFVAIATAAVVLTRPGAHHHAYHVQTYPDVVSVRVDDDPRVHVEAFDVDLAGGSHRFQLVSADRAVDVTLRYVVTPGDRARVLRLDYAHGRVEALP